MTLEELFIITKANIKKLIILLITCVALAIIAWIIIPKEYSATAQILSPNGDIQGIASIANEQKLKNPYPQDITISTSTASKQITVTASSVDANYAVTLVNSLSTQAVNNAKSIYTDKTIQLIGATTSEVTSMGLSRFILLGIFAAVVIYAFYTVIAYQKKPIVLSAASLAERTGLPILATYPFADGGASALAAILLQRETLPHKIALLPVQNSLQTQAAMGTLHHIFENHLGIGYQGKMPECKFVKCSSILESTANLYVTHSADATVVFVNLLKDDYKQVDYVLGELKKSSSNIAGFVVCKRH